MPLPEETSDLSDDRKRRPEGLSILDESRGSSFSLRASGPVLQIGATEPIPENPKSYEELIRAARNNLRALDNLRVASDQGRTSILTQADISRSRDITITKIVTMIASMQAKLASYSHYDTRLLNKAPLGRIEAGISQLGRPIRTQEEYFSLLQKAELTPEERVICRDYATFGERAWKDIGLKMIEGTNKPNPLVASTATIPTGTEHMYTILEDSQSSEIYLVTTDGVGGDGVVFKGKNMKELREKYQGWIVAGGKGGNSFGGALYSDGKFAGITPQTIWERDHQTQVMGGTSPSRLVNMPMFSAIESTRGSAGSIEYKNSIATYVNSSSGRYFDFEGFVRVAQYSINIKGEKDHTVTDAVYGGKLTSKDIELGKDFRARVFIATDIAASGGRTSTGGFKTPHIRGSSLVGGHLEYTSGKWSFTADGGQTYELMNPSMYSPKFKQLPSGEFVMLATKYTGETYDLFARMKQESYLNTESAGLSVGISTKDGSSLTADISQNKITTPHGTSVDTGAHLAATTKIGADTTVTAGIGSTISTDSDTLRTLDLGVQHDLMSLLSGKSKNPEEWKKFCEAYGMKTIPSDFTSPDWLQSLSARIYIANRGKLIDNQKIQEHFASLGLTISGGIIQIKPGSTLYNSLSFRSALGIDTSHGFGMTGSARYTQAFEGGRSATAEISLDYVSAFGRLEVTQNIARDDGSVITLSGFAQGGVQSGRVDMGGGIAIGNIGSDGRGAQYGVGLSTQGLSVEFGTQSLVFGDTTERTAFSLRGIRSSQHQNPGKTVIEDGNATGQYELLYQFLSKSPTDKATIREITMMLTEIGKGKTLTVSEDFARELKPRSDLNKFKEYLERNGSILKNPAVKSIHFDSMSDWLGMFRGTQGTEFNHAGHLLIRSLDDKNLTEDILKTPPAKKLPSEARDIQELLKENQVRIESDRALSPLEMEGIKSLFERAKQSEYADRMKNMTIHLAEDGENGARMSMKWDEKNRVLSMSLSALQFSLPGETLQFSHIEGAPRKSLELFLAKNNINNINDIEVIKKDDPRFKTTDGERSFTGVQSMGGKTYVYEDTLSTMMTLFESSQKPGGIGFFERKKLDGYVNEWNRATIHTLNQFDQFLGGQMSDLKKSAARIASHGGGGLLQGLIPTSEIEIKGDTKSISFIQEAVTTKAKIADITVTLGTGEDKMVKIGIVRGADKKEYIVNATRNTLSLMQKDDPELYRVIVAGSRGTNITTGKTDMIVSVLQKMFFTETKKEK